VTDDAALDMAQPVKTDKLDKLVAKNNTIFAQSARP